MAQDRVAGHRLPEPLAVRARDVLEGRLAPVPLRDAATVVLLRDRPDGPEAYLLRRHAGMAFAAGMTVFPGGGVDPRDAALDRGRWAGPPPADVAAALGCAEPLATALVCAAVRETFEESGVLLAGSGPDDVVADTSGADWEDDRRALVDRELALHELLERRGLVLRADLLRPWAHWVTPEFETRRYDTRFFVAAMPEGQRTRDVGGEADGVAWQRPADALADLDRGALAMLPPTSVTLQQLAGLGSVDAVLAAADRRRIRPLMPRAVADAEGVRLVLDDPAADDPAVGNPVADAAPDPA